MDMPEEFQVHNSFNVSDLSNFVIGDLNSRTHSLQEEEMTTN